MAKKIDGYIVVTWIVAVLLVLSFINNDSKDTSSSVCEPIYKADRRYDVVTFCSMDEAVDMAQKIGCSGYHTHQQDGYTIFMSCENHADLLDMYIKSGGNYGY